MQSLITPDTFDFFARYLLSGFIIISVRSRFVVAERPKPAEIILEALIFSLINQLVFLTLLWALSFSAFSPGDKAEFFIEILFLPAILGSLAGWNLYNGWNHALLRRLSMPIEHPIRRAYDYAFTHQRAPGYVIISFQDGVEVYGYYGENSLAANDANRSDIYLERLYDVDADGQWNEKEVGRSALVNLSGVRSIEFLDDLEF
jgi:hypothetical protein